MVAGVEMAPEDAREQRRQHDDTDRDVESVQAGQCEERRAIDSGTSVRPSSV